MTLESLLQLLKRDQIEKVKERDLTRNYMKKFVQIARLHRDCQTLTHCIETIMEKQRAQQNAITHHLP